MECSTIAIITIRIGTLGVGLLCSAGPLHGAAPRHLGGPGHASDGDFLPGEILLKTIDFERLGGREWLPSETPFQKFCNFLEGFSDPCVEGYHMYSRSGVAFFCNVKKCYTLSHVLVLFWCSSLRRDPRTSFCCIFSEGFSDPRM